MTLIIVLIVIILLYSAYTVINRHTEPRKVMNKPIHDDFIKNDDTVTIEEAVVNVVKKKRGRPAKTVTK